MNKTYYLQAVLTILVLSLCLAPARADVIAVVSTQSPVNNLSQAQIADVFLGKNARFPDGTIAMPVDLAEGSSERIEFYTKYTGNTPVQMKMHWSRLIFTGRGQPPKWVKSSAELKALLAANPNAIGYLERSELDASLRALTN